jgi:hypothetical protein
MGLNFMLYNTKHFAIRMSGNVPQILAIEVPVHSENNIIRTLGYVHRIVGY